MMDCSVTTLQKNSASCLIWKFSIIEAQSIPLVSKLLWYRHMKTSARLPHAAT